VKNRRYLEAADALKQSADLDPKSAETHLALADLFAMTGNNQTALPEYVECLKLHRDWLPALIGLGNAANAGDLRRYTEAAFKRASQVAPNSPDAWIGLGDLALKTGVEFKNAIADFEKAAQLAPERTDFYTDYADALRGDSQWDRAESVLRKRLAAVQDDAMAHYLLGMVLMDNRPTPDRTKEAVAETRQVIVLSPRNYLAYVQLSQLLLNQDKLPEALAAIQEAVALRPLDHRANVSLALAYRRAGNIALADKTAKKAAAIYRDLERIFLLEPEERKNSQDLKVRSELAELYVRTGNVARAQQERQVIQFLKANPGKSVSSAKSFAADLHDILPTY